MTPPAESLRYEIKIPCTYHQLAEIEAWVRLDPAHWRVAFPPRQVNNIYFDTVDCQSLNDNLGGAGSRGKLRLRWYGTRLDTVDDGQLELKHREGMVGWKDVWPFDGVLDLARLSWPEVVPLLRGAAAEQAVVWLDRLPVPVLINHYWRAYHVTADGRVRLTVDTALRAYSQRLSVRPNLCRPAPIIERIVVELKGGVDSLSHERLIEALARFPLRPDRHSKYVHGMLAGPDFDGVDLP
jgi:hypothetical protein